MRGGAFSVFDLCKVQATLLLLLKAVLDYNKHMGGVDSLDQHMCYYPIYRKSHKWYHKVKNISV